MFKSARREGARQSDVVNKMFFDLSPVFLTASPCKLAADFWLRVDVPPTRRIDRSPKCGNRHVRSNG